MDRYQFEILGNGWIGEGFACPHCSSKLEMFVDLETTGGCECCGSGANVVVGLYCTGCEEIFYKTHEYG
jgi:hypothetical protein